MILIIHNGLYIKNSLQDIFDEDCNFVTNVTEKSILNYNKYINIVCLQNHIYNYEYYDEYIVYDDNYDEIVDHIQSRLDKIRGNSAATTDDEN